MTRRIDSSRLPTALRRRRHRRLQGVLCAAAAFGCAAPAALAQVTIGDFETSDSGVQTWNNGASRVVDPTGDSNFMLQLDTSAQWWNRWVWANWSNGAISESNANNNQQLEFDVYFPSTLWANGTANVHMSWEGGAGELATTDQVLTATPDTKQHVVIDYSSLGPIALNTAGWFDLNLFVYPGTYTGGDPTYPQSLYIDNLKLTTAVPPPPPNDGTWDASMSGNWSVAGNWQGGIIGMGGAHSATFPAPAAPQTVTLDMGVTIGTLNFSGSGANAYTLGAAPGKEVVVNTAINVTGGTHSITAPVAIGDGVVATIGGGGSLTIPNLTHNGYGGFTKSGDGTLSVNKLTNMSITQDGGTINLLPGNAQAYGFIYALTMSNGATFNANDNQIRCNGIYGGATESINLGAGSTLTTAEFSDYSFAGTISGAGNIVVGWQESFGGTGPSTPTSATWSGTTSFTGTTLVTNASTLVLENSLPGTSALTVNGNSTVRIAAGGGNNRVIKTATVTIDAGSKVDIGDNKMILTAQGVGTWNGTAYTDVAGLIASGYSPNQDFSGSGIVTSETNATGGNTLTNIGVVSNADLGLATFGGQSVGANDTLVMYTYGGDANLDGAITGDDYFQIDSGFPAGAHGWFNGDFNYDGSITGDDYFVIDSNFSAQGTPIPTSGGVGRVAGTAAVPEPASLSIIALAAAPLLRRRRR